MLWCLNEAIASARELIVWGDANGANAFNSGGAPVRSAGEN
jgi:hypothetical protein